MEQSNVEINICRLQRPHAHARHNSEILLFDMTA
jgi:hypothetical protein